MILNLTNVIWFGLYVALVIPFAVFYAKIKHKARQEIWMGPVIDDLNRRIVLRRSHPHLSSHTQECRMLALIEQLYKSGIYLSPDNLSLLSELEGDIRFKIIWDVREKIKI